MRVLVYKRTHEGDPDASGLFGCNDCMGKVRGRKYDAVIGVGGTGPKALERAARASDGWLTAALTPEEADQGRATLNPLPHVDFFGTLLLPSLLAALGGQVFGWKRSSTTRDFVPGGST